MSNVNAPLGLLEADTVAHVGLIKVIGNFGDVLLLDYWLGVEEIKSSTTETSNTRKMIRRSKKDVGKTTRKRLKRFFNVEK